MISSFSRLLTQLTSEDGAVWARMGTQDKYRWERQRRAPAKVASAPSNAIMIWFKTPMTVVASMNLGLGILLIISSSFNDYKSKKYILLGEIGMMVCILLGALFNQFSTFTATGPPPPFWAMIILNLSFSF